MGEYIYGCEDKSHPRQTIIHGMGEQIRVICLLCGKPMHRIPQAPRVNWNGLRREWTPGFRRWYNSSGERREQHYAKVERSNHG